MSAALRILDDLDDRQPPKASDIASVEAIVGSKPEEVTLDEFICSVIEKVLRDRMEARRKLVA
jgi:hypothetical protein